MIYVVWQTQYCLAKWSKFVSFLMKIVRCPDAIAIVANLSKHLRYISSSVIYIKDHLKRSTDFLKDSQVSSGARC